MPIQPLQLSSSHPARSMPDEVVALPTLSSSEIRALMESSSQSLHVARNSTKARVMLVEWPPHSGQTVVLKDGSGWPWWFRVFIGRHQMKREWKALRFLRGMEGVPRPCFWTRADAFGMERSSGESLLRYEPGELPASAVEQLEIVVNEMHARGVTHGDLHRNNILFDADENRIWLIDWATSCVFGTTRWGWKAWIWGEWRALDLRALAKIKARYTPELLRDEERAILENGGTTLSRIVRRVGSFFKRRKRTTPSVASPRAST